MLLRGFNAVEAWLALNTQVTTRTYDRTLRDITARLSLVSNGLAALTRTSATFADRQLRYASGLIAECKQEMDLMQSHHQQEPFLTVCSIGSKLRSAFTGVGSAALHLLALPGAASALSRKPGDLLSGAEVNECIYLCRSAIPPVKRLAALALSGCNEAESTLRQLLWDADTEVQGCAAHALGGIALD